MSAQPDRGQDAARRAAAIVESVERAASGILDGAEQEARHHIESSRLRAEQEAAERLRDATELADGLVERAERLRGELDRLIEALGSTRERLEETLADEGEEATPPQVVEIPTPQEPPAQPVDPEPIEPPGPMLTTVPEPEAEAEPAGPEPSSSERGGSISASGARLLATQMAMAGNTRQEVAACLEKDLFEEEVVHILDSVFGPED